MAEDEKNNEYDTDEYSQVAKKKLPAGKYWDEALVDKFTDEMEDEILKLVKDIDSFAEQQDEISKIVEKILDISQDKLEKAKRDKYKYFSNCIIFDKRTIYRKHMKFFWEKGFDKMISVKVNSERLHILLLAYAVYYG
mmetsp:Transcript_31713/g.51312  ORF Transcript_31713/g.51312 Transcript_31713/m.51312 type:complete len:138 (-) Transcript_31713:192-605(-)